MAINLDLLCTTVQQNLNKIAADNYPAMKRRPTGFLDGVMSETNRAGFSTEYATDKGDGKSMTVVREWALPTTSAETVDAEPDICLPGVSETRILDTVAITQYTGSQVIAFSDAELRKYCEKPSDVVTMRIARNMSGLFERLNQKLIASYLADVGGFIGGVAKGKNITLLHDNGITEQSIPDGEIEMMEDMEDLGVGRPIVVGAGPISRYSKLADIGCCNDYGQDINELAGAYQFYRDRAVKTVAAGTPVNPILAWSPGAVQLALYNKYRGDFRRIVPELFSHTTQVDPVTGIELDMRFKYDDCTDTFKFQFGVHHELFMLPEMHKAADDRFGVNYAFLYNGLVSA